MIAALKACPMSSSEDRYYRVIVRHNIVVAIETLLPSPEIEVAATPLEVSSQMAANHQANGCLDGQYFFNEPETARQFAMLGLDFVQRMVEKATEHLNEAHIAEFGWQNPHVPQDEDEAKQ